jgi:predicted lysophospholipase L1 biosynthesis ABC-type transport system permease subunit
MTSHPPEDDWTAEDLANQRRVTDEIEKAICRMHLRMLAAVLAAGAAVAVAIHYLSTP